MCWAALPFGSIAANIRANGLKLPIVTDAEGRTETLFCFCSVSRTHSAIWSGQSSQRSVERDAR